MKQHNYKTIAYPKIQQNLSGQGEIIPSRENDDHLLIQELKPVNNEAQLHFKRQEKGGRQGIKDRQSQRKYHHQSNYHPTNGLHGQNHKRQEMFPEKVSSSDRLTVKQQYQQIRPIQKAKTQYKQPKVYNASIDNTPDATNNFKQKQIQKINKKQIKLHKKMEKEKQKLGSFAEQVERSDQKMGEEDPNQISNELLQIFKQRYSYYLIDNRIVFPIEDQLFLQHEELQQQRVGEQIASQKLIVPLSENFNKELQIWNMIVEHSAFFQIEEEEFSLAQVSAMVRCGSIQLEDEHSPQYIKLFKNLHKFYINDIIFQKYEDSSSEEYFSFISLWRYAEENSFLDKLFHTSWNKFILFYISLQRHYTNPLINQELHSFEVILAEKLNRGYFDPPASYRELLDYLIFLINMCFETHTFKALINNKMLFFRDNNKMKNELLEEKKNVENRLWELKQTEKQIVKKEKTNSKLLKKEQKQHSLQKAQEIQRENQEIYAQKLRINSERQKLQQAIVEIDNKIYELCCLPEFSNVWLLGEDKHQNLYWFIRQQESAIYRESKANGEWGMIEYENIELFHQQLNLRGIKEHKLYEKILYYKQLGYIKTKREQTDQIAEEVLNNYDHQGEIASSSPSPQSPALQTKYVYDTAQFDKFSYNQFQQVTPYIVKLMILKSESLMSKYLFQRNSKWTPQENRQEYINKIVSHDLVNYQTLTQELRTFNEKICVVEINIKIINEVNQEIQNKTRKIQTKIWGINEKYKHFWYDYSRRCRTLSDLHFLVSVLYLTIEKYVTKTRKPNNTKYFFKTVELGESNEANECNQHFGEEDLI